MKIFVLFVIVNIHVIANTVKTWLLRTLLGPTYTVRYRQVSLKARCHLRQVKIHVLKCTTNMFTKKSHAWPQPKGLKLLHCNI